MRRRGWAGAIAAVAVLALAGCSSGDAATPRGPVVETPAELAMQLRGCQGYEPVAENDTDLVPADEGKCTLDGDEVNLSVYADDEARENAVGLAGGIGCAFAKAVGLKHFYYAVGPNWTIGSESRTGPEAAAKALGVEVESIDC